ncbi:MAG: circularly permuted type 2 ATP-grasp protein [Gemmatimonadetes bacterium]|nr:circularly permuted type 2 ATP-grasp protein [Gemmatimonadota bacterium]
MFQHDGTPREACQRLAAMLARASPDDLAALQDGVARRFLHEGITFTVLGRAEMSEQIIPIDCVPRVLSAEEWDHVDRGLRQRLTALNLFLEDIYHEGHSLRDGVVPADLVLGCRQYRVQMRGLKVPHGAYVSVCGTDVVRTRDGFAVLEDNLRVPSGVSYMLACRAAMKQAFPRLYRAHGVREVAHYPGDLYATLASLGSWGGAPRVAVLTPGRYNSAYYEHAFLAGEMGAVLVEGKDLVVHDSVVYVRTVAGLKRVDVVYRRIDDDFLDPVTFREDSVLGVPGLFEAYRAGNVVIANAPGTGVADDKAVYAFVPAIIRYFLDEEPILANVETHLCRESDGLAYTIDNIEDLVVKEVGGSGGYGMLVGSQASASEREEFIARLRADPANYISQPVLALSRAGCFVDGRLEPRHVDLRPFVLRGRDEIRIAPGGLCRVALRKGELVVNSSQGGGCKDLWILRGNEEAAV